MKKIKEFGVKGIDVVSIQEAKMAIMAGFSKDNILYTENNMSQEEMQEALDMNILINVGELR